MYLLDTNIVSELRRLKPHGAVVSWMASIPETALFIPAIVFQELQAGVELTRSRDPDKAIQIQLWIDALASSASVIEVDAEIARETARLMHARSDEIYEDAVIAASARIKGMMVVTRNVRDFVVFGVELLNPFE
jgi:predicted nucleic acid-binding protein